MSAHPSPRPALARGGDDGGDTKKAPSAGGGLPASAAKLVLGSFLAVLLLLAADASVAATGSPRRLRLLYPHYLAAGDGGGERPRSSALPWLSVPSPSNFTATLLSRWLASGGSPCREARTTNISVPRLDAAAAPAVLSAAEIHEFTFWALDGAGRRRCSGGDYFELDLAGRSWKSRPPVVDRGDGSYSFRLQVAPRFAAGDFDLTVVLLFRSFEGLRFSPTRFKYRAELRRIPIHFRPGNATLPPLETCRAPDFALDVWSGRWTWHGKAEHCDEVDSAGRYRCLDADFPCERPWCEGPLGALESNGWVYSAHCSFRIFTPEAAWRCLNGKWLFFWGDSNHVDTIRNLLSLVLGVADTSPVTRRFDASFANPRDGAEAVRITNIFNGHWNMSMNYLGLRSLRDAGYRQLVRSYFVSEGRVPDAVVLNSGLHDGCYWSSIRAFAHGAELAARFWAGVMRAAGARGRALPRVFYRTTVATGGYARDLAFNPSKMEAFNGVLGEALRRHGVLTGGVIDSFDMTFPWHYDNRCNDGVHYGREPARLVWRDGKIGHQYFVDLMLGHVLLNAICNA